MRRVNKFDEFLNEANNMKTLKGFLKELRKEYGPTPTPQSLADFIYNNYEEVTGERLEDSDPASNDHIADIIAHFKMDGEDFAIAWEDRTNESVNEKNLQVVTSSEAINYSISYQLGSGKIVAMAATGKDLDKEIESGASKTAIGKDIEDTINNQLKKLRQEITVSIDYGYEGAGYAFTLDLEGLIKKLNK